MTEPVSFRFDPRTLDPAAIPPWPPNDPEIEAALRTSFQTGTWGRYDGPARVALTEALIRQFGVPHVLLCASGTYAVELALRAVGVGSDDEVYLAGYDFPGNFRTIEALGARPVLLDLVPGTWRLDPGQLDVALAEGTRPPRAILVSHLHGDLVDMAAVRAWADQQGVAVVEDACQVPGATLSMGAPGGEAGVVPPQPSGPATIPTPAGACGDVGVLSFGGSKLLTAGRGGAVLFHSEDAYQRAKIAHDRGNEVGPLAELAAAVLVPQLDRLSDRHAQRQRAAGRLLAQVPLPSLAWKHAPRSALRPASQSGEFAQPPCDEQAVPSVFWEELPQASPAFYKLPWRVTATHRESWIARCRQRGIPINTGFPGFHRRSGRRCRRVGALGGAAQAAAETVILHHPLLLADEETLDRAGQIIREEGEWLM